MQFRDIVRSVFMYGSACIAGAIVLLMPTAASAALKYEPGNYAARGNLLLQLDGIRNVGMTKAHDGNAATWVDLAAGNIVSFGNKTGSGVVSEWADDGYVFGGGEIGRLANNINFGNAFTIQLVYDADKSTQAAKYPFFFDCGGSDKCGIYTYKAADNNQLIFRVKAISGISDAKINPYTGRHYYATALYDKGKSSLFETETGSVTAGTTTTSVGSQAVTVGGRWSGTASDNERYLTGTIKAVRVYNKVLSAEELAQNRALDEVRFFAGIPVTNVVVATAVAGLEGNEESGAYAYDEDGYIFTAPKKATKDGANYACTGYTLETWNGTGWSAPVRYQSTSCSLSDTAAKVRLTWQWQRASDSASVELDPLFDDYVTDGLILHLDGIRNVGVDKPHSWASSQWIDLVKGNVASFHHDAADASTWTDDGYYFGGRSFAQFANALSGLTNMVTVQVVCYTATNALHALKTSSDPNILWPNLVGTGDNDQLNIYYDMNAEGRGRLTFKNANGGNVNLANGAAKDAWEGRYVTAIRNGAQNYILQTTAIADAVQVSTDKGNIAANTLRVGGACSTLGNRQQRWFLGTIKSVRIYDRVLSDEELALNRAVDEVRFFGAAMSVTNVVVASSVRGVSGDTPEGAYALSAGGHTFTAPASVTVGEDSYSCTGYMLETWDGSAWGEPVSHSGTSAALTDTTAKYRLTWQWTHTAGPGYDAAFNDYVTDGLVVHLDGIRNTGYEPVHDATVATWADLANPGDYARFVIPDADCGWKRDGYYFDGKSVACYAIMNTPRTLGTAFTAQAVVDFDVNNSPRINTAWPGILGTTATEKDYFAMYYNQNNRGDPVVNLKVDGTQVRENGFKPWAGEYVTGLSDGTTGALFQTVTPDATTNLTLAVGTRTFTFCGGNGDGQGYTTRRFNGIGKAARIYNRALTNEELARNRAADEVRFFGRSPAATGDLVVTSTVEGLGGDLPCGAYRPAAGYQFTAQTEALLDDVPYELTGYTLETWDGSAWSAADVHDGVYAVAPDVTTASKRLTWNWVVKSRLTKIPDYDVGDYVQDGLYLFFDGIRNAGKTVAHDDNATTWVNLGTGGANLNAEFDYVSNASAGDGWEADGYHFKYGGKFARIAANPAFGWQVTIQVVCEAETSGRTSGNTYPTYIGSTNDYLNVYGFGSVARTFFKIRNNSGDGSGRFELSPSGSWQGKYLTAIWHAGKYQLFQSVKPVENQWYGSWRKWWDQFKNQPFYIGGVYNEGDTTYVDERRLTGKIQAIRVYNRSLLDEELEHNRMVDEARFKGNPPEANVTIATKYGDGTGEVLAEGTGHYKVEGTYTFSATSVKDANGVLGGVAGFYLETYVDGVRTGKTWHDGNSFAYTEDMGNVRIVWSTRPGGIVLILK